MAQLTINLSGMRTLVVDADRFTRSLTAQILRGFGADPCSTADSGKEAMETLGRDGFDLCIMEAKLPDMACGELIRWIRRHKSRAVRYLPILVLSSYTQLRHVADARDAGANMVARKPVSPQILYNRIAWMGRAERPFVEAAEFVGPDRRFRAKEPPDGRYSRRSDEGAETPKEKA